MSTEIEQRVVEMQFDNKQFERNVSTTMSSLDKLKQSLNLTGAAKGLESVGASARGINLSGLTSAAETVGLKFNAMWTIADQALRNITNSAYQAGKRIVSALTIDPIKTGFSEYETQINAVQTILANTKSKGTNIDDVNGALDELNAYADKTIYNFTEMTRNIGTFTAAGVDLDKSVTSIKGIANLAAVSGSTSQQASTAMYQLSQALAAGKVQLMDWNSVVNAGMGGEVFQNALKRTATHMGTNVDAMIKKYGSFRESLTKGEWLTAEVLTETLTQLSGAYTEAELIEQGYTEQQAKEIVELAKTAESAATDVKTFSQLWDTLKESAQSGWTQTWEILVGDFEEAKEMLSKVSKVIGDMIGDSAQARNELLQGWKDAGGRADLLEGIKNAFNGIMNIVKPIKEAFHSIFPPTTVDQLVNFTKGFKNLTASFAEFTASHGDQIRTTFEGIFSIIDIGWTFVKELAGGIGDLVANFAGFSGGILDASANLGKWLLNLRDSVKEGDIFGRAIDKIAEFIRNCIDKLKAFGNAIKLVFQAPGVEAFLNIMSAIWDLTVRIGSRVGEIFAPLGKSLSDMFHNGQFSDLLNDGLFAGVLVAVYKFVDNLNGPLGALKDIFDGIGGEGGIIGGIKDTLDSVRGCFEAYQNSLNAETIKKIATAIAILAAAIFVISSIDGDKLDHSMGAITILFGELIGSLALFTKMNFGTSGLVKGTAAITGLASALLILAAAMKLMSTMSWSEIAIGITGTVVGLGALVAAVNLLPKKNVIKASKAIGKLATAVIILAAGMKIMASMSWQEMGVAIAGVVVGLGALVAAVNLLPKDAAIRSMGMVGLATAMVILGGALKLMSTMSWDELGRGLAAMGGALAEIVIAMNLMPPDMALRSLGIMGLATAMVILGAALKSMGGMSWEEIGRGLAVMGGALVELAIALNLMRGTIAGAGALLIAAGALAIMAPVMKTLGSMSWEEIGRGLVMIAGAFAVVGIAGALLAPLAPTLLILAAAMALFGLTTLGIGVGIAALAAGFTALATAGSVGAAAFMAALSVIVVGIIDLIPTIVDSLGDAVVALCDVIIAVAPKLAETLLVVISEVLASLASYTPQIVNSIFQFLIGLIDAIAANMPQLIASAVNLVMAFFKGVVDALRGIDTTALIEGIAGVGLLTGLMLALSTLSALIPSAMVGVLGLGVLIAELALVLAAVGALAQIPGLSWMIDEGGDLLQHIGTAIGQFVGGLIGGIAEGATSTLPAVATNLSSFMTNLQPFIDGAAGLDASMVDGVSALASAILVLTGAGLIDAIASWISGGSSLSRFAEDLVPFGTAMKNYANEVAGIDTEAISVSVDAAKGLVEVAKAIPGDGLFGTDGIDDFGENVVDFAKSMKKYADEVTGIDANAITSSVTIAENLKEIANAIPSDGFFGTDGIDDFGDNILDFGKSLKKYSEKVAGTDTAAISNSAIAVRTLVGVINSLGSVNTSGIKSFKDAINDLAKTNVSGFVKAFNASTADLSTVGTKMISSLISGFESKKGSVSKTAGGIAQDVINNIESKKAAFKTVGVALIGQIIAGMNSQSSKAKRAAITMVSSVVSGIREYYSPFKSAGKYLVQGFAAGISANTYLASARARAMAAAAAEAAREELDEHSPSKVGYEIGDFFGIAFVNAIADNTKRAYAASADMANSAKTGLANAFDKVSRIISGDIDVQPTISPVLDLTNVRAGANAINGMFGLQPSMSVLANVGSVSAMMNRRGQNGTSDDVVAAINKLRKDLGNVGNTSYNINGVTYDDGSAVSEAIRTIIRAVKIEGRV